MQKKEINKRYNTSPSKWEFVDWSKKNREIADELNILCDSQVSRARKRYAPHTRKFQSNLSQEQIGLIDWERFNNSEVAAQLKCSLSHAYTLRNEIAPETQKRNSKGAGRPLRYDFNQINSVDWSLSNVELARKYDITPHNISRLRKRMELVN